jgi:hypothetical protein
MADIYLGLTAGTAILLPPIRWTGGGNPGMPIDHTKQIDKATMLDGSPRFNFRFHHPRRWQLAWEMLTAAELAEFLTLHAYESELAFQNNWMSADWLDVVITAFEPAPVLTVGSVGCRYNLTMTLDEVI